MTTNITQVARQYIKTKKAFDSASVALSELEVSLYEHFEKTGSDRLEVDGHTIVLVKNKRRSFDVTALKNLVSPALFRKITEPTVKTKLWDSALALGKIDSKVVQKVVTTNEYDQLRVK